MDEDTWWLHLYVLLSRATTLENLLVIRAPPADFLLRGPPAKLRERLEVFAQRCDACRARAEDIAQDRRGSRWGHNDVCVCVCVWI